MLDSKIGACWAEFGKEDVVKYPFPSGGEAEQCLQCPLFLSSRPPSPC